MKKNSVYNTKVGLTKVLTKKDFSIIYGLTFLLYFFSVYYCKNQIAGIIIVGVAAIFPIILYITRIARKTVREATVNKYFGILGVYDAVICALLAAYQRGKSVKEIIIIFAVICIFIAVVIGLLELTCRKAINNSKKTNRSAGTVGTAIIPIAAAAGVFTSKYMRANGIKISYEIIMCVACLMFSFFYLFWMKYRSLSKLQ